MVQTGLAVLEIQDYSIGPFTKGVMWILPLRHRFLRFPTWKEMNLFPDKGTLRDESFEDIPDESCGDTHPVGLF